MIPSSQQLSPDEVEFSFWKHFSFLYRLDMKIKMNIVEITLHRNEEKLSLEKSSPSPLCLLRAFLAEENKKK